jgi:hypothetical protein
MTFAQLRRLVRDAARTAFAELRAKSLGESFYAFALQSLDDATGVYAAANTEDGYRRCAERYSDWDSPPGEYYYRWYWGVWAYTNVRRELFGGVYDLLNEEGRRFEDADLQSSFKAAVFGAMAAALRDLDNEGLFGTGPERERITLLCTVEDS